MKQGLLLKTFAVPSATVGWTCTYVISPKPHSLESIEDTDRQQPETGGDTNTASQTCPFSDFNLSRGVSGLSNLLPKENSHAIQCNTTLLIASRLRKPPSQEAWVLFYSILSLRPATAPGGAGTSEEPSQRWTAHTAPC